MLFDRFDNQRNDIRLTVSHHFFNKTDKLID
jgi:hypothetical protein